MTISCKFYVVFGTTASEGSKNIYKKFDYVLITNVVRNEFLRRFDRLVKGRKVRERSTVRKNPLKGKIVISRTPTHNSYKYNRQKNNNREIISKLNLINKS